MAKSNLTNESVLEQIKTQFNDVILNVEPPTDMLTIEVKPESIHALIAWVKQEKTLQISFLTNIGGVHFPDEKERELVVVYHLHSLINNFRIRVKAYLSIEKPEIDSVVDLYAGANWMERETYDFYGIVFNNHPNLTRILNEDSMDYFPMRKEYHLEDATREDKDNRFFGR